MRKFVSVVAFLAAVFAQEENSLECYMCLESGSATDCAGSQSTIPAGVTQCISGMENNTLGSSVITSPFRAFRDPRVIDICGKNLFLTATNFFLGLRYDCCDTTGCNNGPITGPYEDAIPNGLECPACLSEEPGVKCIPNQKIACKGNQLECAKFDGTATRPTESERYFSIQGCVSENGCKIGLESLPATKLGEYTLSCTSAKRIEKRRHHY